MNQFSIKIMWAIKFYLKRSTWYSAKYHIQGQMIIGILPIYHNRDICYEDIMLWRALIYQDNIMPQRSTSYHERRQTCHKDIYITGSRINSMFTFNFQNLITHTIFLKYSNHYKICTIPPSSHYNKNDFL